jgi:hypothetical protein
MTQFLPQFFETTHEIKFEHFILKAVKSKILTLKPKCKNEIFKMHAIIDLFEYLVKKGILKKNNTLVIFKRDSYIINSDKSVLEPQNMKKILSNNADYPELLKCYHLNYKELSKFLKNYKEDTEKVLKGGYPQSVWGKNPELEKFWGDLASRKYVVVIDKTGPRYVDLPKIKTKKYKKIFDDFKQDKGVKAVITSNPSVYAYEEYLYPKAKNKTVKNVLNNYTKYFKQIGPNTKLHIP